MDLLVMDGHAFGMRRALHQDSDTDTVFHAKAAVNMKRWPRSILRGNNAVYLVWIQLIAVQTVNLQPVGEYFVRFLVLTFVNDHPSFARQIHGVPPFRF